MKKLFSLNYINRIGNWVWQGKFYILSTLVVFFTILYIIDVLNFYPDIVSLVMTIGGLLILLNVLMLDAREFSDQRPNTPRNWIKSFPTTRSVNISLSSGLVMVGGLKARVTGSVSENATIENKVEFLLRQVSNIQESIANVDTRVDNVEASLTKEIKELTANLCNLDASIKTIIASHAVGTYDLNFFGIIITLCGTVIQFFST